MNNSYRSAERVAPPVHMPSIQESIYHTLLYTVFQRPSQRDSAGMVVALTSTNPREGVSYVTRALVRELAKCETNSVAQVHARFLGRFYEPTAESFHQSLTRSALRPARNACEMGPINGSSLLPAGGGQWEGSWRYRRDCINLLRREYSYTLIDCPSLRESGDVLSVAPFVDGVIFVVEADRTRNEQVQQAERKIEAAQGTFLGHVLNKRTYPVPEWLYKRL